MTTLLFGFASQAAIDYSRFEQEMKYLRDSAFIDTKEQINSEVTEKTKTSYFNRKAQNTDAASDIIDLDQVYFTDSISTKAASPKKD
ncbi:MAG: hypothetical protein KC478_14865 [Bacteriovoracaceae bacterium]|nr:hypothetical protein [Bacteriovoracaceae bacterium]